MEQVYVTEKTRKRLTHSMYDAVIDGVLMRDIPSKLVFVKDEAERDALEGYRPGQFAAAYGMTALWQLGPDGEWITVFEPESEG